ncbi:MAG TPA: hypothetical protein VGE93_24105 [Bryobacteraceae bacterium]
MTKFLYCARCGRAAWALCFHPVHLLREDITPDEAERIRARYALGKQFNPDHDTTSYRDRNGD